MVPDGMEIQVIGRGNLAGLIFAGHSSIIDV